MKVYITKYALTEGVIVAKAEIVDGKYAAVRGERRHLFIGKKDWFKTQEEANVRVKELFVKKLSSLQKQTKALLKQAASAGIKL